MLRAPLVLALAALATVTACSSSDSFSQPKASAFRAGSCRRLAPDVLTIGREVRKLGTGKKPPAAPRAALKAAQTRIRALQPRLEPALRAPVQQLVVTVGVTRFRSDLGSYEPSLGTDVSESYDKLVKTCTGPAAKP